MADSVSCPWCGFESRDEYAITLHIEQLHTDDSPFVVRTRSPDSSGRSGRATSDIDQQSEPNERWIKCTRRGCGQYIAEANVDDHLDMHDAIASGSSSTFSSRSGQVSPRVLNGTGYARPRVSSEKAPSQMSSTRSSTTSRPGSWQRPSSKARSVASSSRSSVSSRSTTSQVSTIKAPSEVSIARHSTTSKSVASTSSYSGSSVGPRDALKEPQKSGRLGTKELGPYAFEKSSMSHPQSQTELVETSLAALPK